MYTVLHLLDLLIELMSMHIHMCKYTRSNQGIGFYMYIVLTKGEETLLPANSHTVHMYLFSPCSVL